MEKCIYDQSWRKISPFHLILYILILITYRTSSKRTYLDSPEILPLTSFLAVYSYLCIDRKGQNVFITPRVVNECNTLWHRFCKNKTLSLSQFRITLMLVEYNNSKNLRNNPHFKCTILSMNPPCGYPNFFKHLCTT